MYELMSGYRPFQEYRSAVEMRKALQRGERPSLVKAGIDTQMPLMEALQQVKYNNLLLKFASGGTIKTGEIRSLCCFVLL